MRRALLPAVIASLCAAQSAAATPEIVHVAGSDGSPASLGDGFAATAAKLDPVAIDEMRAADASSTLRWIVADYANCRLRFIQGSQPEYYTGTITTAAGTDCTTLDNRYATATDASLAGTRIGRPTAVAVFPGSSGGNDMPVLFASGIGPANRVHIFRPGDGVTVVPTVQSLAGGTSPCSPIPPTDGAAAYDATLCDVRGLDARYDIANRFLIADARYNAVDCSSRARVYEAYLDVSTWRLKAVAGGSGGTSEARCLYEPTAVLWLSQTEFLVADVKSGPSTVSGRILKFDTSNTSANPVVVASGLSEPTALTGLQDGRVIFAEAGACRVRRLESTSAGATITTVAGSVCGAATPDAPPRAADTAVLPRPSAVHMAPNGLLIADPTANRVWMVDRSALTTRPPAFTNQAQATVGAEWLDAPIYVYCQLYTNGELVYDNWAEGARACTFPMGFTVGEGDHEFRFRVHGEPASDVAAWRMDATAPGAFAQTAPDDGVSGLGPEVGFAWQAAGDPSGIARYELWLGESKVFECAACTSATRKVAEGNHSWLVKAFDSAGNARTSGPRTFSAGGPPTAALAVSPNPALLGRTVTFDGSASSDAHGPIARYEWDLDGNGSFELDTGTTPTTTREYASAGTIPVSLRVTDGAGATATASAELRINAAPVSASQFGVTINNGAQYTRTPEVTVTATFPSSITQMLFSNDGGFLAPGIFAPRRETAWRLDSSGPERLPKTIYVRFLTGGLVSETHQDDIILDETPPRVEQAALVPPAGAASIARVRVWRLRLKASDSNSGVAGVQVTADKRKPGKLLRYRRNMSVRSAVKPRWVRARDKAGNNSRWRKLR